MFITIVVVLLALHKTEYNDRYRWLDRAYVGTTTKIVLKKLVLDQFLMTPPLLVIFYLSE